MLLLFFDIALYGVMLGLGLQTLSVHQTTQKIAKEFYEDELALRICAQTVANHSNLHDASQLLKKPIPSTFRDSCIGGRFQITVRQQSTTNYPKLWPNWVLDFKKVVL